MRRVTADSDKAIVPGGERTHLLPRETPRAVAPARPVRLW